MVEGVAGGGAKRRRFYEEEGEVNEIEEISFSSKSQSYCVCFVSMMDSTETTFTLSNPDKIRRYYSIFINMMAAIARNFDAKIIKNTGTSSIHYFPKTSNPSSLAVFKDVIECGLTMMTANKVINMKLKEEGLPSMHYKISADYGTFEVARSLSSPDTDDLFGSTMNVCAKINSMAPVNGMVIGSDLYCITKKFSSSYSLFGNSGNNSQFHFKKIGEYSIMANFKYQYPVYSVSVDEGIEADISCLEKQIPKVQRQTSKIEGLKLLQQRQKKGSLVTPGSNTIMLVDDEPDILLTYETYLASAGYKLDAFTDPREAIMHFEHIDPNTYNLVLMDIRMPNLNVIQLYYRLKAINSNIKILFISAIDAAQEMISILPGIGVDDVIRKPVDIEQFLFKVKAALENKARTT